MRIMLITNNKEERSDKGRERERAIHSMNHHMHTEHVRTRYTIYTNTHNVNNDVQSLHYTAPSFDNNLIDGEVGD